MVKTRGIMVTVMRLVGVALLGWVAGVAVLWMVSDKMIYPFQAGQSVFVPPAGWTVHRVGAEGLVPVGDVGVEDVLVWRFVPPEVAGEVIIFVGNAGVLLDGVIGATPFLARDYAVTILAYPGVAQSSGAPSQETILAAADKVVLAIAQESPLK